MGERVYAANHMQGVILISLIFIDPRLESRLGECETVGDILYQRLEECWFNNRMYAKTKVELGS